MSSEPYTPAEDGTHPDIPEKSWTNPFTRGTPMHSLYDRRVRNEQDIVIIVSDFHNRRGTGKTIGSLQLAAGMDQTPEGITPTKVSLQPEEIREAYASEPPRSALVLDESEVGATKYRASSNVNQALREIINMGRVEQKYLIMNAPSSSHIDTDLRSLADVWMLVMRKGLAVIHFLEYQPYASKELTPKKQLFEWTDIDRGTQLRKVYNYLTRKKRGKIAGEEGEGFIPKSEHREILEKAKKEVRREARNDVLYETYHHEEIDVSYRQLGEVVGMTKQSIGEIIRNYEDGEDQ